MSRQFRDREISSEVVRDPQRRPVLVPCAQGVRRAGTMVAGFDQVGYERIATLLLFMPGRH